MVMAKSLVQGPQFEPLILTEQNDEYPQQEFNPFAHDLVVLNGHGSPEIAKNASVGDMISVLSRSNSACREPDRIGNVDEDVPPLILIRFEENQGFSSGSFAPPKSDNNWSQLWQYYDSCCNDSNSFDFVSRIRQPDPHCESYVFKESQANSKREYQYHKIFYSFNCGGKAILITHQFHPIESGYKELVWVMTYGVVEAKFKKVLYEALQYLKLPLQQDSQCANEPKASIIIPVIPHPKAILCSMLECVEENCRKEIAYDRHIIEKNEEDMSYCVGEKPKGLQSIDVSLSNARIRLGNQREKLQYLESSIASLEETSGLPEEKTGEFDTTTHIQLAQKYGDQLQEVKKRLKPLKGKCRQLNIYIDNLKERVEGIVCIVSILLAEKENEYSHEKDNYQHQMLKQQHIIASRAKRDNSVMKVIAVLSAFFLPGTFIATFFSVPIFKWDQDQVIGPHFKTYWYFTAPVTAVLVVGFSLWFAKMWYDDRRKKPEDEEIGSGSETTSFESREGRFGGG